MGRVSIYAIFAASNRGSLGSANPDMYLGDTKKVNSKQLLATMQKARQICLTGLKLCGDYLDEVTSECVIAWTESAMRF